MKTVLKFAIAAVVFEIIAFWLIRTQYAFVVGVLVALCILLVVGRWFVRTARYRKDLPPSMTGRVVRKRHWHVF